MEKIAVVTGSSSGIGFETALALSREGHFTYATMRDLGKAEEIKKIATSFGAKIHHRQNALSQDHVFKQLVIRDAADKILEKNSDVDIFISLQANSPEIQAEHLDSAIEKFLKYNRSELFSVDKNLMQNAAFRIFKRDYVFQQDLSTNCGVFVCDIHDVHTEEDVMYLEKTQ